MDDGSEKSGVGFALWRDLESNGVFGYWKDEKEEDGVWLLEGLENSGWGLTVGKKRKRGVKETEPLGDISFTHKLMVMKIKRQKYGFYFEI